MRFVKLIKLTENIEKLTIVPPCPGYYEDVSFQVCLQGWGSDETEQAAWFMMGTRLEDAIASLIPNAAGEVFITPELDDHNLIQKIVPKLDVLSVLDAGPVVASLYTYNFGRKRLNVGKNSLVHLFFISQLDAYTNATWLLVQGSFLPYKGAIFKEIHKIGDIDASDNWTSANRFVFPLDLKNCQVLIQAIVTSGTAGKVQMTFRLGKNGIDEFADTIADAFGYVLDEDMLEQTVVSGHGMIGQVLIEATADVLSEHTGLDKEKVFEVGDVYEGDFLAWDGELIAGSDLTTDWRITIAGIVANKEYSHEAFFFKNGHWVNVNTEKALGGDLY